MSKTQLKEIESIEVRLKNLEEQLDKIMKEIEFLENRLERLERLPHNIPKDVLAY